jgi:hypothetical protein
MRGQYTKTFALCDNVDVRVHCRFIELNTACGIEYDEEYNDIELLIGDQVVKLEGEIVSAIFESICDSVTNIDAPDGAGDDYEDRDDILFEMVSLEYEKMGKK